MSTYTALLGANVLYPAPLRDLLLQLAVADMFRAKRTARHPVALTQIERFLFLEHARRRGFANRIIPFSEVVHAR